MNWNAAKQKFLAKRGSLGDCWSCCIAAVLGLPRARVPFFLKNAQKRRNGPSMTLLTQEWLNKRGMVLIELEKDEHVFRRRWGKPFPEIPYICCGPTPRSKSMRDRHAVVIWENKIYDPHPSNAGLTAITHRYLILRVL